MAHFLSLKWKIVLVFSLVLIAIHASLVGLVYLGLQHQFSRHREQAYQANVQKIQGLVANSYQQLERLASTIPLLQEGYDNSVSFTHRIQSILNRHWCLLQRVWDVEAVRFYSSDNQLLVSRGKMHNIDRSLRWAVAANKTEQPVAALEQRDKYMQYVAAPLLVRQQSVGVLLLGRSLANIVPAFHRISGNDIGVMIAGKQPAADLLNSRRWLPEWNMRVTALTNAERNLSVLHSVSKNYTLETKLHRQMWYHHAGQTYEVRLIPLESSTKKDPSAQLVVISDVTRALADIRSATRRILLIGLIGLMTSEALLLLLLWTPMARLRQVALSLPLLAEHAFEKVRFRLNYSTQAFGYKDEIDVLNSTAITLSYQLEALHTKIQEHTCNLVEYSNELARERDFVTGLLNTAQVVILTQSAAGRVVMINRPGQALIGRRTEEIVGQPFSELLTDGQMPPEMLQELEKLLAGKQNHVNMDAELQCKGGKQRTISWAHSRLRIHSSHDATILSVGHDVTEREQAERQLTWLADHDSLTRLLNWRGFQHEFEQILRASQRHKLSGGLLYFDLDQFKYINDASGHQAGDALLWMIADKLRQVIRTGDVIARLGNDEFAVIIHQCDVEEAILVAKEICAALTSMGFSVRGHNYSISISIGIALFPLHGMAFHDLMANAELAMHQAKCEGGGRWHLFSSTERAREQMRNQVYWKEQVEQALREDRFLLYFQPVLDTHTNTIGHYEVLLRMRDHKGQLVFPDQFIPVAEQTGLIHLIDHLVIRKAIIEQARLHAQGHKLTLSVNLSGRVVDDPELLPLLTELLGTAAIAPSSLMFEVTETAAVVDMAAAESLMQKIKALGCRFAVDDFGAGFSSLFYLKRLPVDYIKIDGMFIRQLATNNQDRIFVRALSEIAKALGKKAVAEFVENKETLALLREYGVDYVQGYYIGKPSPQIGKA